MAQQNKKSGKNDRWRGLLILLLLLLFVAKDKIMEMVSPCECDHPEPLNNNFPPPPGDLKGESLAPGGVVEGLQISVEAFERGEDENVLALDNARLETFFNPQTDSLDIKKYTM